MMLQNIGTQNIWYKLGDDADAAENDGFCMEPKDVLVLDEDVVKSAISAACAAGQSSTLAVQEI